MHQWYWGAPSNGTYRYRKNTYKKSVYTINLVTIDYKGTNLSNVEKLGECSMFVKVDSIKINFDEDICQPKSVKVIWDSFIELYITLFENNKKRFFIIIIRYFILVDQSQWFAKVTIKDLLRREGQNLIPKTEKIDTSRNWGFPKGCKPYFYLQDKKYKLKKLKIGLKLYGNGVSVLSRKNNKRVLPTSIKFSFREGIQFISSNKTLADKIFTSGKRFYTSKRKMETDLVTKQEIEVSYKQLWNINLLKTAYTILKSKEGNLTEGVDKETLDGISLNWAEKVIISLKNRKFQFNPSRIVLIPKANGKMRSLGVPSPRDKVIQQAYKMILESVFEMKFLEFSHGFRPNKSTITAIHEIRKWNGITWIIEGDIKNYFDSINHTILANLISREIKDQNLIDLYWKLVKAGYVNNGKYTINSLGVPQGGVLSPLLSNIYLHEFDLFMKEIIEKYSDPLKKRVSKANPVYLKIKREIKKLMEKEKLIISEKERIKELKQQIKKTSAVVRDDTTAKRVYYNRYADDWVVGIIGRKALAEKIKEDIKNFLLNNLEIKLNEEKTKIINLGKKRIDYLGFEIGKHSRIYTESQKSKIKNTGKVRRPSYASILIYAPIKKLILKLIDHGFVNKKNKPKAITKWIFLDPQEIILRYNAVMRGILNYYSGVENKNLLSQIIWILKFSAVFTLARKWNISPVKVFKKLGKNLTVKYKTQSGKKEKYISIYKQSLSRTRKLSLMLYENFDPFVVKYYSVRSNHVWDQNCIICREQKNIEMHHVRHLRKKKVKGFTQIMQQLNRKQIPVCRDCHLKIHMGQYNDIKHTSLKDGNND
jgi:group II intron reverse transcriptase/maturase